MPSDTAPLWATRLHQRHWGVQQAPEAKHEFEDHEDRAVQVIEKTDLPAYFTHSLLVRKEYEESWNKLRNDLTDDRTQGRGQVLCGNEGTGKSMALYYLLIKCLRSRITVALVLSEGTDAIVFDGDGVRPWPVPELASVRLANDEPLVVLYGGYGPEISGSLLSGGFPTYVIYAETAGQAGKYRNWAKEKGPSFLTYSLVKKWEMRAMMSLCPGSICAYEGSYHPEIVFDHLGPSLHSLKNVDVSISGAGMEHDFDTFTTVIHQPASFAHHSGAPPSLYSSFFAQIPRFNDDSPNRWSGNPSARTHFVSFAVAVLFASIYRSRHPAEQRALVESLHLYPSIQKTLYQAFALTELGACPNSRPIFPVTALATGLSIPACLQWTIESLALNERTGERSLQVANIHEPGIDGVFQDPDGAILLFQTSSFDFNKDALERVLNTFDGNDFDDFFLVYIVPDQESAQAISPGLAAGLDGLPVRFRGETVLLPIGYAIVPYPWMQEVQPSTNKKAKTSRAIVPAPQAADSEGSPKPATTKRKRLPEYARLFDSLTPVV